VQCTPLHGQEKLRKKRFHTDILVLFARSSCQLYQSHSGEPSTSYSRKSGHRGLDLPTRIVPGRKTHGLKIGTSRRVATLVFSDRSGAHQSL